jgi:hypothetical protein
MNPPISRLLRLAQRLVLWTARGPFLHIWAAVYRGFARASAAYLTRGEKDVTAYARAGLGKGDFLPGLSDIDLVLVVAPDPAGPGVAAERVRQRWWRTQRALKSTYLLLDLPRIYDEGDLSLLVGANTFTYGLDRGQGAGNAEAVYVENQSLLDRCRMLERPGLYAATDDWVRFSGRERLPVEPPRDAQAQRMAAWLELAYLWRVTFRVGLGPIGPRTASLCVKLVSEPARIWLWLAHGERAGGRVDALERTLRRLPEEEASLRCALELQRALRHSPEPPLAEALAALVRFSSRIVETISAAIAPEGTTAVQIAGADPAELIPPLVARDSSEPLPPPPAGAHPLCDWRSLTSSPILDESFTVVTGDPGDPATLRALGATSLESWYKVMLADHLMVLPAQSFERARMRAISCAVTDPVSFALLAGRSSADFPNVRGWSADDVARRATAERGARLRAASPGEDAGRELQTLFAAARADLFLESLREGDPVLPVTVTETARRLGARSGAAKTVCEAALLGYRELAEKGAQPDQTAISALRRLVLELPAYREPSETLNR